MESEIGALLECSVCLEQLDSEHKVLPCQHTFCLRCLKDIVRNKGVPLLCPECRTKCVVPLASLPSNVILNRILEGIKAKNASDSSKPVKQQAVTPTSHAKPQPPQQQPLRKFIPGNLSTNPFLPDVTPTPTVPALPPKLNTSVQDPSCGCAGRSAPPFYEPPVPPPPPPAPASTPVMGGTPVPRNDVNNQNNRKTSSPPSGLTSQQPPTVHGHQLYKALYDYIPVKSDELRLKKDDLYIVVEKCKDGWFKGSSLQSLKTGFFPGNYVIHVKFVPDSTTSSSSSNSTSSTDLIDFSNDISEVFSTTKTIVPPNVTTSWSYPRTDNRFPAVKRAEEARLEAKRLAGAAAAATTTTTTFGSTNNSVLLPPVLPPPRQPVRERCRCIMSFPASSPYELDLTEGDVIYLHKRREDGWCKGTLQRTGKTGLFPASFVQKL